MKISTEEKTRLGLDSALDIDLLDAVELQLGTWTTIAPFIDGLPTLIAGNTKGDILEVIVAEKFDGYATSNWDSIFVGRFLGLYNWENYPMFRNTKFTKIKNEDLRPPRMLVLQKEGDKLSMQPIDFFGLNSWFGR